MSKLRRTIKLRRREIRRYKRILQRMIYVKLLEQFGSDPRIPATDGNIETIRQGLVEVFKDFDQQQLRELYSKVTFTI